VSAEPLLWTIGNGGNRASPFRVDARRAFQRAPARDDHGSVGRILVAEDSLIVRDLMTACRKLADAGQTIVLVEQNLAATLALAQRAYIINNGHIVHEGPAQEIKARPEVLHRHLGV
jgi:hypothetical protein